MKKDEMLELAKVKSNENCCLFCESKCTECGSVNIEVNYYRFYNFVDNRMIFAESFTEVCCHDCEAQVERQTLNIPGMNISNGTLEIIENRKFIEKPSLGNKIDECFDDKSMQFSSELKKEILNEDIESFALVYKYENDTRNYITIQPDDYYCIDKSAQPQINKIAKSLYSMFKEKFLSLECKEDPDNPESHWVIECKKTKISR